MKIPKKHHFLTIFGSKNSDFSENVKNGPISSGFTDSGFGRYDGKPYADGRFPNKPPFFDEKFLLA